MQDINFFTAENMSLFWTYSRSLLKTASPGVMITFSVVAVGYVINIIVKSFKKSAEDEDEIEIKHY